MRGKVYNSLKRMLAIEVCCDTYSDILQYLEEEVAQGNIPQSLYLALEFEWVDAT